MMKIGDVFGEYEIIETLKEDESRSPCAVYKGRHITSKMFVAIKVPRESLEDKDKTFIINQLHEEEKILYQLRDVPYIIEVIDKGMWKGYPYIIMPYISDRSLNDLIMENTQGLPLKDVEKYIQQAAEALQHAHSKRIINCDIKPEHILLTHGDEEIAICDFGLAVQLLPGAERQPRKSQLNGVTRHKHYMAPEQKGKEGEEGYHCCASDQFALGLVAYELLNGKLSDSTPQITKDWGEQRGFSSMQIPSVLEKALAPIPENRFKTIQIFADTLTEAVKYELEEAAKKPADPVPTVQPNKSSTPPPSSKLISATPTLKRTSDDDQSSRSRSVAFSRRTFFKYVPITVIDATTLGVLGASWVELEPKLAQLLAPQIVHSILPIQFGTIYNMYHGHQANVNGVAWAPDNKRIASASYDGMVQIWYANNGVSITNFTGNTGTIIPVYDVTWSPTENKVASCSNNNDVGKYTMNIWDASDGNILSTMEGHNGLINAIAWSPDGKYLASASFDNTVKVWDAHIGSLIQTYRGHTTNVYDVTWSPDSTRIASCSIKPEKAVHVWDALSAHLTQTFGGHTDDVLSVSWIPTQNGNYVASSSVDETVRIWSAIDATETDRMPQKTFEKAVRRVRWSRNGKYLAAGTRSVGSVHVWEAATGREVSPSPYNEKKQDINSTYVDINALAWSPDGTMIATGGTDKLVHVWSSGLADAGK